MDHRHLPKLVPLVVVTLAFSMLLAACSNPLADDPESTPGAESAGEATFTPAPPMAIVTATPVDPTAVAVATAAAPVIERPETYVVEENDTLYGIAARFNVELSVLVEVNGLSDPNDIWVGQELTIPPE